LEINHTHHIIKKISLEIDDKNKDEQNKELIHLLYDQACIIEGEPVYDVSAFSKRLNSLFEKLALIRK
jgi:molecular chaperone HtpG